MLPRNGDKIYCNHFIEKYFFLLVFILPIFNFKGFAQISFSKQYSVNHGLPSSEIYDLTQDRFGRIWYATNNGMGYFDGYSFNTLSINNNLRDNSIVRIIHGKDKKLWFLAYSGELNYYENGSVKWYKGNTLIRKYGHVQDLIQNIQIDSQDNIWFPSKQQGKICKITSGLSIEIIDTSLLNFKHPSDLLFFEDRCDSDYYSNYIHQLDRSFSSRWIKDKQKEAFQKPHLTVVIQPDIKNAIFRVKNIFYVLDEHYRLHPLKDKKRLSFEGYLTGLRNSYVEKNGNVWIRIINDGVLFYPKKFLFQPPLHYFQNMRITHILHDRDGNYWGATDGDGLFLTPSFQFNIFDQNNGISNENITSFDIMGGQLFFATNDNNIYKASLSYGRIIRASRFFISNAYLTYGRDILCHSDGTVWVITSPYLRYTTSGKKNLLNVIIRNKLYQAIELDDHSTVIATNQGLLRYVGNNIVYDSREEGFNKHIRTIFQDDTGYLWLGTMSGLYELKQNKFIYFGKKNILLSTRISAINQWGKGLIVGTHNNGIIILGKNTVQINTKNGIKSNFIKSICVENDSTAWIGTNNGLEKIVYSSKWNTLPFKITHYSIWDGLPSNEINEVKINNHILWIATNKGMASISVNELRKNENPPQVFIEHILINDHDTLLPTQIHLKHNQNNITFFYKAVSFNGPGDITYKIKLDGIDNEWITTRNTSARYKGLPAGKYTFHVKAANTSGIWSDDFSYSTITIKKHFTKELWFILLIIFSALIFLTTLFLIVLRSQHRKNENKRRLLLSEQKALRAQMNPHFIFNSLSSIQYLILKQDMKNAEKYLSNFSSLMRKVLENSKYNVIALYEELETLTLYLELEKMRFEDKFDYQIRIDHTIAINEFHIPPMLIQPYLENAIWHGFMQKEGKGLLILSIEKYNNHGIAIKIEDNGIGRQKAGELYKRKNHKSTGIKNIEERITLINKIYKTNIQVKIIDLYSNKNHPSGTRVELYLPMILDF